MDGRGNARAYRLSHGESYLGEVNDIYERNIAQSKMILDKTGLDFLQWPTEANMLELLYGEMRQELIYHPVAYAILADDMPQR